MARPPRTPDESERQLDALVAQWTRKAGELVDAKIEDAAAHAANTVTRKLRATRDGRPTLRAVDASRSSVAALARIEELRIELVGPRKDSLSGLLRDARADFYEAAFDWIRPYLVPGVHRLDGTPTKAGDDVARGAVIHGYDLGSEFDGAFRTAGRTLTQAVNLAAGTGIESASADLLIGTWEEKQRRIVTTKCRLSLSDSARALLWAVEQALRISP